MMPPPALYISPRLFGTNWAQTMTSCQLIVLSIEY